MFPASRLSELISYANALFASHPELSKDELAAALAARFGLSTERSVFVGDGYAVRFSSVRGAGFPNTVLGLGVLKKYDTHPFIVCVVRPTRLDFVLANSTFLTRISHSSHLLSLETVRGSFLGSDISSTFNGLPNRPEHFEELFELHSGQSWDENLARLVESSSGNPKQPLAVFSPGAREAILAAARLSRAIVDDPAYREFRDELHELVQQKRSEILIAALSGNINVRGNSIEQVLTGHSATHELADLSRSTAEGVRMLVDIKTKLRGGQSSPKGFNVQKLLDELSDGKTVMSFLFLLVDLRADSVQSAFVSILDSRLIARTAVQMHWAGRGSRGATQITGDVEFLFAPTFVEDVDVPIAESFLERLIQGPG